MGNTERTPIVDKNGKHTHVNKRVDQYQSTSNDRISKLRDRNFSATRPTSIPPKDIYKKRDHDIIELRKLAKHVKAQFGNKASSIEFETDDQGAWLLLEVADNKGYPIWNLREDGEDIRSGDIEYKIATVDTDASIDEGIIATLDNGSFELDFDEINDKGISTTITAIENNTQTAHVIRNIVTSVYPDATGIEFNQDSSILRVYMGNNTQEFDVNKKELNIVPALFSWIDESTALDTKLFGLSGVKGNRIVQFDYLDKSRYPYD